MRIVTVAASNRIGGSDRSTTMTESRGGEQGPTVDPVGPYARDIN